MARSASQQSAPPRDDIAVVVIVMGVSGCGKSTIAERLAVHLDGHFRDGDELHPPHNIRKMASGEPLTDADRAPWLEAVRDYAARAARAHGLCVIACSALKRAYRDTLNGAGPGATNPIAADDALATDVFYVHLQGSRELIGARMRQRTGHFMPETLLDSQFEALESPANEPRTVTVDITPGPDTIALTAAAALRSHPDFPHA